MNIITSKWFPWLLMAIMISIAVIHGIYQNHKANADMETYKRQLAGQLSTKEQALETANKELGTANSKLEKVLSDKDSITKEFAKFKKDNQLTLKSKDELIASLQSQSVGQSSTTTVNGVVSYHWKDAFGRFELTDPNIATPNDATFTANQMFMLKGQIYKQSKGFLEARRIELTEVYKDGDEYKTIPNSSTNIIDSQFQYVDAPEDQKHIFNPRLMVGSAYDFNNLMALVGVEILNWHKVGLGTYTLLDTHLSDYGQGLGLTYTPLTNWNFALTGGISTRFSNLGHFSANAGAVFYLNN